VNGTLPKGWTTKKLDELGFVGRGKSRHRPRNDVSLYDGGYPFVQTGDVKAAELYLSKYSQTYNEKGLAQSKLWAPETLCITIAANIADTAILKIKACFPDSVVGFVADHKKADVRFVKYYIDTIKLSMQNVSKGTTQDNLSLDKLMTFDFAVPPIETQQKIATILSIYDDLIENNIRRIKVLEEMTQTIYREWFVNFRFPGHEKVKMVDSLLGKIPEAWEVKPVSEKYKTGSGGTPSRKHDDYYGGEFPWIKTRELKDGFVLEAEEKITGLGLKKSSAKLFPEDTVIIAMYGATIGRLGILTQEAATNQACCALLPLVEPFGTAYIYWYLLNNRKELISLGQGAAQQNISQIVIKKFEMLVPETTIVERFNQTADLALRKIKNLSLKNKNLRQARNLLLPKLISGAIDVSELEVEVEVA